MPLKLVDETDGLLAGLSAGFFSDTGVAFADFSHRLDLGHLHHSLCLRPDLFPLAVQVEHHHRFDDALNFRDGGEMRPTLSAHFLLQAALEQATENGGFHLGPVQFGGTQQIIGILLSEGETVVLVEQATVEVTDVRTPEFAPGAHRAEQLREVALRLLGVLLGPLQQLGEQPLFQQPHVFTEHGEHHPHQEMRHLLFRVPGSNQSAGHFTDSSGRFSGDALADKTRVEHVRVVEHRPQYL